MLRSLPSCVEVLRVLEALVSAAKRLAEAIAAEEDAATAAIGGGGAAAEESGGGEDVGGSSSSSSSSSSSGVSGGKRQSKSRFSDACVAFGEELSQVARSLLQRTDLALNDNGGGGGGEGGGGSSSSTTQAVPGRVLAYCVSIHLAYASKKLRAMEAWASNVLPLLSSSSPTTANDNNDDNDDADDGDGGVDGMLEAEAGAALAFPTLTRQNYAHYFSPLLSELAIELKGADLGNKQATKGRDQGLLLLQVVCE
jgi:hypothetical protein